MTREQKLAAERLRFAKQRVADMTGDQRATLTTERLVASYGIAPGEAAMLLNQFARRA
jgi:hypothetical protein